MQLEDQRHGEAGLQVRQLDLQLPGRLRCRQQQAPTGITQSIEQVEQPLFPFSLANQHIQVVDADQLALLEIVEDFRAVLHQIGHRQVDGSLFELLETQAGRLQQVAAADAVVSPEVDEAFRPASLGFAQTLDISQCRGIGTGIVVGEGGVVAQTHTEGKLNRFHARLGGQSENAAGVTVKAAKFIRLGKAAQ